MNDISIYNKKLEEEKINESSDNTDADIETIAKAQETIN